jgi:hypothetical protein
MVDHSEPIVVDRSSLKDLAGKTALITGASSGIGLETAEPSMSWAAMSFLWVAANGPPHTLIYLPHES